MHKKLSPLIKGKGFKLQYFIITTFLVLLISILDISSSKLFNNTIFHEIFDLTINFFIIIPLVYIILQQKNLLEEKEEFSNTLFKKNPNCTFVLDKNGIIIDINPSYIEELGKNKKELIGQAYCNIQNRE